MLQLSPLNALWILWDPEKSPDCRCVATQLFKNDSPIGAEKMGNSGILIQLERGEKVNIGSI